MSYNTLRQAAEALVGAERATTNADAQRDRQCALDRVVETLTACHDEEERPGTIRRILVAFDDSPQARWALDTAVRLAEELGAEVGLVNVIAPLPPMAEPVYYYDLADGRRREEGQRLLQLARSRVPERLMGEQYLRDGVPDAQIVEAAREWRADLIVIGTHGRGRLAHLLIGSTAEGVCRRAPCPVMTVSREPGAARGAFAAGPATADVAGEAAAATAATAATAPA